MSGPLLFLVYLLRVNELLRAPLIHYHKCADDTTLIINFECTSLIDTFIFSFNFDSSLQALLCPEAESRFCRN